MEKNIETPTLYLDGLETDGLRALIELRDAGFSPEVRQIDDWYRTAYGAPLLFGLSNIFKGLEHIRVFILNASPLLQRQREEADREE